MPIYAVTYAYDDRAALRDEVRPRHRAFLSGLHAAGVLLASGPVSGDGASGALLLLRAESPEAALRILDNDPFQEAEVIAERTAVEWTVVFGPWKD